VRAQLPLRHWTNGWARLVLCGGWPPIAAWQAVGDSLSGDRPGLAWCFVPMHRPTQHDRRGGDRALQWLAVHSPGGGGATAWSTAEFIYGPALSFSFLKLKGLYRLVNGPAEA